MLWRPLDALRSSAELLNGAAGGGRLFDGMLSRMVHGLSRPFGAGRGDGQTGRRPCCGATREGGRRSQTGARGRERRRFE